MNYQREMVDRLRIYAARKKSLDFTAQEIRRIDSMMTSIQSATKDGTPVSGGTNQREDRLINCIMEKVELENLRKDTEAWIKNMDKALSTLETDDYRILDVLYIHPVIGGIEKLCSYFGTVDPSTIYRRKNRIIRQLTYIFYGAVER